MILNLVRTSLVNLFLLYFNRKSNPVISAVSHDFCQNPLRLGVTNILVLYLEKIN